MGCIIAKCACWAWARPRVLFLALKKDNKTDDGEGTKAGKRERKVGG